VAQVLNRAIRVAVARRGVAVVVIPGDVALRPVTTPVPPWIVPTRPLILPGEGQVDHWPHCWRARKRVTLFCGAGCAGAHDEVIQLAHKLQAPIVHTLRGKEYLEYDNPYDVGMTGLVGFASGYKAMKSCDTLLIWARIFPIASSFRNMHGCAGRCTAGGAR